MQHPNPRFPMHVPMGGNMMSGPFGGQQRMMNPYGSHGPMMGLQQNFNSGRPMRGQTMGRGQGRKNGGGLLSKILGGKKQLNQRSGRGGLLTANRPVSSRSGGGGSILQTLSNPESLTGFLNNTQQVLKTAQSIGPMIQQYGPIVKNLPMMWKLYKGFKDLPTEEKTDEEKTEVPLMEEQAVPIEVEPERKTKRKKNSDIENETENEIENEPEIVAARKPLNGPSIPKLYI